MQASLVMFKADGERKDFPLPEGKTVVGRRNTCELRIPLSSVSRKHCEIELNDDGVFLRDLGSSNGTFFNDQRVQEAQLTAGDRVQVGPVFFHVVVDGEPSEIEPVRTVLPGGSGDVQAADESGGPEPLPASEGVPEEVEAESHSPTVDLDDDLDPISALEAMADNESDGNDEAEDLPLLEDDDEEDDR